jgi:hypothetical protein
MDLPDPAGLEASEYQIALRNSYLGSIFGSAEGVSGELLDLQGFVEFDGVSEICQLKSGISLLCGSWEVLGSKLKDDAGVIFAMFFPFVLPQEDVGG